MFIPLHMKSHYSLGCGTASVVQLVEQGVKTGYGALGLTDLDNLYGQVQFHHQCRAFGIRPVTCVELRQGGHGRNQGSRQGRVVLLALDEEGYRSICRIISLRNGAIRESGHAAPCTDLPALVRRHNIGVYALSDDPAMVEGLLASGGIPRSRVGMLLVRPDPADADRQRLQMAARLRVPVVADLDVVLPEVADEPLHRLLLAVRLGVRMDAVQGGGGERWLREPLEAAALFADVPEAIAAGEEIAAGCRLDLGCAGCRFGRESSSLPRSRMKQV